jgi:pimeloyl-ACP methyl ester carboxylesterase
MFDHAYAELNGIRLHYAVAGSGKLMLFLHGFPEFWYAWRKQLDDFGRDHLAVAPDMRGYNLSSKPKSIDQYGIKYLIEDVRALAEHLGADRFTLVAHDWGGGVAWAFALAHPEYLERLVVINMTHPGIFARELRDNPAQQKASEYMVWFQTSEAEQRLTENNYAQLLQTVIEPGLAQGYFSDVDRRAYLDAWSQPGAITGGLNYYRAARLGPGSSEGKLLTGNYAADPTALKVQVPTLVIWGEKDPYLLPGNLNGLEEFVPHLTVKRIPAGTHWVIHEHPRLVNQYIRDFIAGNPI